MIEDINHDNLRRSEALLQAPIAIAAISVLLASVTAPFLISVHGVHAWITVSVVGLLSSSSVLFFPLFPPRHLLRTFGAIAVTTIGFALLISTSATAPGDIASGLSFSALLIVATLAAAISHPKIVTAFQTTDSAEEVLSHDSNVQISTITSLLLVSDLDAEKSEANPLPLSIAPFKAEFEADLESIESLEGDWEDEEYDEEEYSTARQKKSDLIQSWNRSLVEDSDQIHGSIQAQFQPGQKQTYLHLPFWPVFNEIPQAYCECQNSCFRAEFDSLKTYGGRLVVRRSEMIQTVQAVDIDVTIYAPRKMAQAS